MLLSEIAIAIKRLLVDYTEFGSCFEERNMSHVLHYECRLEAETKVLQEPGVDYCK